MKTKFKYSENYCTSRKIIEDMQNHTLIKEGHIKTSHVKEEYDAGVFGWVKIEFDSISLLLMFYKDLLKEEIKDNIR
ncbi:hypothetical protein [Wocania ichthyoenteri]|uniref:hypothetical protein n=1 Tax=Wocania ichthyoenteri TaxID=1230531 RepID=UPI00053E684A|nr:hypothetical protein [Wocania ichthyoenteri]